MRAAYVCADSSVPVFGRIGCSVHVQEFVRALTELGADVDLFAANVGTEQPSRFLGLQVHHLSHFSGNVSAREQAARAVNNGLSQLLSQEGPFDFFYERYSLWSFAAMEFARQVGKPGILEVNAPLIEEQLQQRELFNRSAAEEVARRAFTAASVIVSVSKDVANYLGAFPETRGKVHVQPNGVNPARFPHGLQPALPAKEGSFIIGFLGSLKPWHGLRTLVEAFGLLYYKDPNVRLLVVGDGPERTTMTWKLMSLGLMEVAHFTGSVAPSEVPGFLASMNVGVAPYPEQPNHYFSPLKVFEYMAAGLPVVASRIGQLKDIIQDELNGLLCSPGDPLALAEALRRLKQSSEMRQRLGRAARMTVLRDHTWNGIVRRVLQLAGVESPGFRGLEVRI